LLASFSRVVLALILSALVLDTLAEEVWAASWTLVGWNNLGMHCMDADYAIFSLLPPYNTIYAQLIDPQGGLVTDPSGVTITYEAVTDPDGSINRTSVGKSNFWDHVADLFGVDLPADVGLNAVMMPGAANVPQPMTFEPAASWFVAEGIPITPYDDAGHRNFYPLMRLVARDTNGSVLAMTDIVLPVSDETDCRSCHASGASPYAMPYPDWVKDKDPQRDMRLNILRLHDNRQHGIKIFQDALAAAGYNQDGLFATATTDGKSVLCARCHLSEALKGSGMDGISPLTQAVHRRMAYVLDPLTGMLLDSSDNRSACYRCHPGSVTRCLRGPMGSAVAADGTRAIQCQSCHGSMLDVASKDRTGWLEEPACQNCHTGTAISNNGEIRYLSAFDAPGMRRVAVDQTFATNADTPAPGLSLYRFSIGHGGLACEACHGPTHAENPSSGRNDNIQSFQLQGHVGSLVECASCHGTSPNTVSGGPHGMHPVGQVWIERHTDAAEEGGALACRSCHGSDYRGTVLSRAQADRTLQTDFGTKHLWRGFQVGCYTCHQGPNNSSANPNHPPTVSDDSISTAAGFPVSVALQAHDADGNDLTIRIVSQPQHGTVALDGTQATFHPEPGFSGSDMFTFAAWDGSTDSNLGTIALEVQPPGPCVADCNHSGNVSVDELVLAVHIALGMTPIEACHEADADANDRVTVDDVVAAVAAAVSGCTAP